jgi:predicted outer membrane lipoprotein
VGAVLSFFGFIHAGTLSPAGAIYAIGWASGWSWAVGYLLAAIFFALTGLWVRHTGQDQAPREDALGGHG